VNSDKHKKLNLLRRHPIIVGTVLVSWLIIFFCWLADRNVPAPSTGTTGTAAQAIIDSYDADRLRFKDQLTHLNKPMPNLRWLPEPAAQGDFPNQMDALLVTPYGPCANLTGNSRGYSVVTMHVNPFMPAVPSTILGSFADQATAATAAEKYCRDWYSVEANKPQIAARTDHMWFTPDAEEAVDSPAETSAANSIPSPDGNSASTVISSGEAPAGDGLAPIQYKRQFDRELTTCILSKAPHNGFSSPDTGLYSLHILNDLCRTQYSTWVDKSMATGDTRRNCAATSLGLAQDELRPLAK
jgi:hypothetical protein